MIIDAISDLHGCYPKLEGGDLLILAGDYTASDRIPQWIVFFKWLKKQKYKKKIIIAGNHDNLFEVGFPKSQKEADELREVQEFLDEMPEDFEYLCDSGTEFEGLKIWGSPWTKTFHGINPKCKAFTLDFEEELASKFSLIPDDTDILITHSPPFGILDSIPYEYDGSVFHAGSHSLRKVMNRVNPKLWVFGHIHEGYGEFKDKTLSGNQFHFVNVSHVNERYLPVNKAYRFTL